MNIDMICFPETYPGPWRMPISWSTISKLQAKAREHSIYILAGTAEECELDKNRHQIVEVLIDREGEIVGKYRQTTPIGPWIYLGGQLWDFNYKEADELPVFDTEFGKIGILQCSEVYVPELARVLALKGAEIIFMPAGGGDLKSVLRNTWRTLVFARAIENLAYTITTQNIFFEDAEELAMVASPENIIFEEKNKGLFTVDIDLDRVRWLRKEKDRNIQPLPWKTKPGVLKPFWRRPDLYKDLLEK